MVTFETVDSRRRKSRQFSRPGFKSQDVWVELEYFHKGGGHLWKERSLYSTIERQTYGRTKSFDSPLGLSRCSHGADSPELFHGTNVDRWTNSTFDRKYSESLHRLNRRDAFVNRTERRDSLHSCIPRTSEVCSRRDFNIVVQSDPFGSSRISRSEISLLFV